MLTCHDFMLEHGRLPRIGDENPPWKYRGWLLPYVQGMHLAGLAGNRWGYYLRTLEAGKLLDEPVPKVLFGAPDRKVISDLEKWPQLIGWDMGGWSDFQNFIDWLSWGLALCGEEPRIEDGKQEKLYRGVNLGPMMQTPADYLGMYISERKANGWNPSAFYPTPMEVCHLMVEMTMHDEVHAGKRDLRTLSVLDPCVGTGRMLLAAGNHSMNLWGMDIDRLVCQCTKINGALYCPWMTFPLPHEFLGLDEPMPAPPAPLPTPEPPPAQAVRVDDRGQGLLFNDW